MAALSHVKSNSIGDVTGTVTVYGSNGSTQTAAATGIVRPSDWNSAHNFYQTISGSTLGQSTASGTNLVFGGTNGVRASLSTGANAATLWFDSPPPNRSYIEIMNGERITTCLALSATSNSNKPMFCPFWFDGGSLNVKTARVFGSYAGSSNRSFGGTFRVGLYSADNSTRLTLVGSDSMAFSITASSQSSAYNGGFVMDFTGSDLNTVTMNNEGRWVLAFMCQPVSANATWMAASMLGGDNFPMMSRFMVGATTAATNNTSQFFPFWGGYSTTTNAMPNSVAITQINGGHSSQVVDLYAVLKEI